jgi:histidinol dehydrogenase
VRALSFASKGFDSELAAFCRGAAVPPAVSRSVAAILSGVREKGDAAVARFVRRFDGARLKPREFRVKGAELAGAERRLPAAQRAAIRAAHAAVRDFNRAAVPADWEARNPHGAAVGEKFNPIHRVGIYVPGGEVPLISTVIMTATLAKIAGCPEIAAFTPSDRAGAVAPELLAALHFLGVWEVYRIGGAQAIGAMAYGTRTIPRVDKIFGPGNAYVCEAKRQVFGVVGIDLLPGPSELMVIADESARRDFAAADLLAQAEHGSGRERIYLVATSLEVIAGVAAEMEKQLGSLGRSGRIRRVLEDGFLAVRVSNLSQAAEVANRVAPEHLQIMVRRKSTNGLVRAVTTAGAIMIGGSTPTALGDFAAGPSHVLPTGGAGRFSSGLRVDDFMRRTSVIAYDPPSLRRAAPVVAAFAGMERLDAHGASVARRVQVAAEA